MTTRFELPEFDEWSHQRLLPKAALRDGTYYIGRCGNPSVARWNARQQCFYHWRQKFGRIFIQKIKHPVDEPLYDVFGPVEELEKPRFETPFYMRAKFRGDLDALVEYNERVWCTCSYRSAELCPVHCAAGAAAWSERRRRHPQRIKQMKEA
jgi:hypothetical protein